MPKYKTYLDDAVHSIMHMLLNFVSTVVTFQLQKAGVTSSSNSDQKQVRLLKHSIVEAFHHLSLH
jgi:hypothetical protein